MKPLLIHLYHQPPEHWQRIAFPERCREEIDGRIEVVDARKWPYWELPQFQRMVKDSVTGRQDFPTREKPVSVRINRFRGNDNWALFFPTLEEAEEVAAMLLACQPLDWDRDILGLGFVFVN